MTSDILETPPTPRATSQNWLKGIVAILSKTGRTAGTGFVVSAEGLIVTCAHVLSDQIGAEPGDVVTVRFAVNGQEHSATVTAWWRDKASQDVALLSVLAPLPEEAAILPLVRAQHSQGHPFVTFGYHQTAKIEAIHSRGTIRGLVTENGIVRLQLYAHEVSHGFSGAPVWDETLEGVAGIIQQGAKPDSQGRLVETSFATPSETVAALCPHLVLITPFRLPFPRNKAFVGRNEELETLHRLIQRNKATAHTATGLTGMGGMGKTQLAVEYTYRYQNEYPDGIFWLNAANPLTQEFANLGTWFRPDLLGQPLDTQLKAVTHYLHDCPDCLLVLDNLQDSTSLDIPLSMDLIPSQIPSHRLFTSRQHQTDKYPSLNLNVLSELSALQLLLRHRSHILNPGTDYRELETAKQICHTVGYLPLALKVAGAFLGEYPDVDLDGFLVRLNEEGRLATLDEEATLSQRHEWAVGAVLQAQWDTLRDENARLLLRVAGQLPEATQFSTDLLAVLAGVAVESRSGRPAPLGRALRQLETTSLVERLQGETFRLHPLVREFARMKTPAESTLGFQQECVYRLIEAYIHFPTLAFHYARRGIYALQQDIHIALDFHQTGTGVLNVVSDPVYQQLQTLLRLLQREAYSLWPQQAEHIFFQQILYRLTDFDQPTFLKGLMNPGKRPYFSPSWLRRQESRALERTLMGHHSAVNAVAVTPDGTRAVSASWDGTLKVWRLDTGAEERTLVGHTERVYGVAMMPDGIRAISASHDGTLKVWHLDTGAEERTLVGHTGQVRAVAVMPDGVRIISASADRTLRVWHLGTGVVERVLMGHSGAVNSVVVTPDGLRAISASTDQTIKVWNLASGVDEQTFEGHRLWVRSVAVTPDGSRAISASADGTLKVWNLTTGAEEKTLVGHTDQVCGVAVLPGGTRAVSVSSDRMLKIWNLETGETERTLLGHAYGVRGIAVTPDGRKAISACWDGTLKVWVLDIRANDRGMVGHTLGVNAVAMMPDGGRVISASHDRTLRLWHINSGIMEQILADDRGGIHAVAVTPDGTRVILGFRDGSLKVWHLGTGTEERIWLGHGGAINAVTLTPDGNEAISASADGTLKIWHWATGAEKRTLAGHTDQVRAVATTPDGGRAISASADGTLKMWQLATGSEEMMLVGHTDQVRAAAVTPDGARVISASNDHTLKVWCVDTGAEERTLRGHTNFVWAVITTSDGVRAISASADQRIKVWHLDTGEELASIMLDSPLTCVTVSPDGEAIVAGNVVGDMYCLRLVEPSITG